MSSVQAVIFDWGGTLTPWHNVDILGAWRAHALDDAEAAERLLAAEGELWARSRDEHRSFTIEEVYRRAGHEPTAAGDAAYHSFWDEHTITDEQAVPMLRGLRERGISVGVLSNTPWSRRRHEEIFARDGVLELIDGAVYTSEIPYNKPHVEAFRAAMDAVGVSDPARAVYVGDRLFDDIFGAQRAGMRAVLVPHSDIPAWQIGGELGEPDAVIERLADLLAVIDAWSDG